MFVEKLLSSNKSFLNSVNLQFNFVLNSHQWTLLINIGHFSKQGAQRKLQTLQGQFVLPPFPHKIMSGAHAVRTKEETLTIVSRDAWFPKYLERLLAHSGLFILHPRQWGIVFLKKWNSKKASLNNFPICICPYNWKWMVG